MKCIIRSTLESTFTKKTTTLISLHHKLSESKKWRAESANQHFGLLYSPFFLSCCKKNILRDLLPWFNWFTVDCQEMFCVMA